MSLIELTLALLLTGLLLFALISFFLSAIKTSARTVTRARLQQTATVAMMFLIQDLQRANAGGLSFLPNAEGVMVDTLIHPVDDISGEGLPIYSDQELVHYHLNAEANTYRRRAFSQRRPAPVTLRSGEPMRFHPEHVQAFLLRPAEERLFREVKELRIHTPGVEPQYVGNPLHVRVVCEQQAVAGGAPERIEVGRSVVLRNSL